MNAVSAGILLGLAVTVVAGAVGPARAQELPPVASVDFYGRVDLPDSLLRMVAGIAPGALPPDSAAAEIIARRLEGLSAVGQAEVAVVCCDGGTLVYVGVQPPGAEPGIRTVDPPVADLPLPPEIAAAVAAFDTALRAAAAAGNFAEDDSLGHSLMRFPPARAAQERFVALAERHGAELRAVLRTSNDPAARAAAAQVLAYSPDKRAVVAPLVDALRDPDPGVRNNAMRALALIAALGQRQPELGISVPWEPFVALLRSPVWTDLNKASFALVQLTATRDAAVLAALAREARPELIRMSRWHSPGHALPALIILGRMAGMDEGAVFEAVQRGERERVIAAAGG